MYICNFQICVYIKQFVHQQDDTRSRLILNNSFVSTFLLTGVFTGICTICYHTDCTKLNDNTIYNENDEFKNRE